MASVVADDDGVTASWLIDGADTGVAFAFAAVGEPGSAADGRVEVGFFPTARDDELFRADTAVRCSVDVCLSVSLVLESGTVVPAAPRAPVNSAAAAFAIRFFSAFLGASPRALRFFDEATS